MTQIETQDEAVLATAAAISTWSTEFVGSVTQGNARVAGVLELVLSRLSEAQRRLQVANALLQAADAEARSSAEREVASAEAWLAEVQGVVQGVRTCAAQMEALVRKASTAATTLVPPARADLQRRLTALAAYQVGGLADLASDGAGGARTATTNRQATGPLDQLGLTEVEVGALDFSDNPIQGSFGRGTTDRSDYRWAVETWHSVVGPAVSRGADRSHFERRDEERGAPALRRTADVYDLFLGTTDRIVVSVGPDGRYDVINGRHRLEVARELGIKRLPAQVNR